MPDINDVPNELLVETFSYSDLETLTRCMRVSKLFKAITEHSTFDKIFFRTKAIGPEDPNDLDKLQINPIFRKLHYTCRAKIKSAHFLSDGKPKHRKLALIDSSAAKQDATEPAVTCIYVSPYKGAHVKVTSRHAVTVLDVLKGLCDYYALISMGGPRHFFQGFTKTKETPEDELVLKATWAL